MITSILAHVVVTSDENDLIICKNQFSTFVVGMTGFGGKRTSSVEKVGLLQLSVGVYYFTGLQPLLPTPKRPADSFMRTKTLDTQVI